MIYWFIGKRSEHLNQISDFNEKRKYVERNKSNFPFSFFFLFSFFFQLFILNFITQRPCYTNLRTVHSTIYFNEKRKLF